MLIDARTIPDNTNFDTDICIIGAGAAGITLAREFIGKSLQVCLLESGGFELDAETQSLYHGEIVGDRYYPLDIARLRYFGGTTNHWQGASIVFNKIDFETRDWVPYSGWPITLADLVPYYKQAQVICEVGPLAYDAETWESPDRPQVKLATGRLINAVLQSGPPTRFGEKYREEIIQAANINTFIYANVTDIETPDHARSVTRLRVTSLEKNPFWVRARAYILATGGIENARLLLLSNKVQKAGLGNQHDLVGRFFMEHPVAETGYILPTQFNHKFYGYYSREFKDGDRTGKVKISGYMMPSESTMREERLLNCGFAINNIEWKDISEGVASLKNIIDGIKDADLPDNFLEHLGNVIADIDDIAQVGYRKLTGKQHSILRLDYWAEQAPDPDSRVTLSSETDQLGQNQVKLDWRLNEQDRQNIMQMHDVLAHELGRAGLGRLRLDFDGESPEWMSSLRGSYHHMGTTRIHVDPKQGVVDENCQVHGISNLFIAGSSVFPTVGHANPTLTIVALSLRLAEHLKGVIT